jgi:acyl carrier protein
LNKSLDELKKELKERLVESLALENVTAAEIGDDTPLFGDAGLGLDSLDGVELVVMLQRHYGLDVKELQKGKEIFRSINTLAAYINQNATK